MNRTPGTIYFRLFGVPVFISPFSWLILALLGGGMRASGAADIPGILVFVVVGMVVLLTHEFGHALVGRAMGGTPHVIVVEGLGAVTHSDPPRGRWRYFLMVLAGPAATLLPGLVAGAVFALQLGGNPLAGMTFAMTYPLPYVNVPDWVYASMEAPGAEWPSNYCMLIYVYSFVVSVWWCLFNLLPVLPLDGGQLFATLCRNHRVVCIVGMLVSIAVGVWTLSAGNIFLPILFGYFAYLNWQFLHMDKR